MSPKVSDEHKEMRSKAILLAAKHVFSQKGYISTTMKDVVEQSGMSRGSVYMYFSSTEQMMLALIAEAESENLDEINELIETSQSMWELVVSFLKRGETSITKISSSFTMAIYEFYLTQWRVTGNAHLLEQRYDKAIATISTFLQLGTDRGEFQPLAPNADIARVIVSLIDGMTWDCTVLDSHRIKLGAQLDVSIKLLHSILQPQTTINKGADH